MNVAWGGVEQWSDRNPKGTASLLQIQQKYWKIQKNITKYQKYQKKKKKKYKKYEKHKKIFYC